MSESEHLTLIIFYFICFDSISKDSDSTDYPFQWPGQSPQLANCYIFSSSSSPCDLFSIDRHNWLIVLFSHWSIDSKAVTMLRRFSTWSRIALKLLSILLFYRPTTKKKPINLATIAKFPSQIQQKFVFNQNKMKRRQKQHVHHYYTNNKNNKLGMSWISTWLT